MYLLLILNERTMMQTQSISDQTGSLISWITKIFLALNLAVYAGFTVAFLLFPIPLANVIGYTIHSSAALADFRAMYSGLCFGVGLLVYYGLVKQEFRTQAILLSVASAAGLFIARLYTLFLDGPGNEYIYLSMATEIVSVFLGAWLLRKN
ncbi:hypothetical protein LEP1GSC185_1561 [Leptospira licerasiae serovar Varillal str. VAR 010]|uniref:PF14248 domain protein n=2 Tax=Leptospira licerasiae TaxID=447106 RepID=A0ABP2RAA8_9LEPT|nr:hypothetical protein LEP1GSC185_1561 [Leptospira licerasiae serovar Varillal str. VAR 010]EJZ41457.1 PF14248 domain protein [Leptospira licerasiae str. MMD4847]